MELVKQTDFRHIHLTGCLFICILDGVQEHFQKALTFEQIAYSYRHLVEQKVIDPDCYVNSYQSHNEIGNLACSLLVKPDYEVLYIGKKDYRTPADSFGQKFGASFTVLHGITEKGGHHFRQGDSAGLLINDPYDPPPKIIGESSLRYYVVKKRYRETIGRVV